MKLIVITPESNMDNEIFIVKELIRNGVIIHIRKKGLSEIELKNYLNPFSSKERKAMSMHGFHQLASKMSLGGIHLNGQENKHSLEEWKGRISKSIHSFEALKDTNYDHFDYCFLSPVFDSISKKGYLANFNHIELADALENRPTTFPVIALGGVHLEKLKQIEELNFDGAALLGDVWKERDRNEQMEYLKTLIHYVNK